jgi:hypothetical protein
MHGFFGWCLCSFYRYQTLCTTSDSNLARGGDQRLRPNQYQTETNRNPTKQSKSRPGKESLD